MLIKNLLIRVPMAIFWHGFAYSVNYSAAEAAGGGGEGTGSGLMGRATGAGDPAGAEIE
jgi:hypothetical protein